MSHLDEEALLSHHWNEGDAAGAEHLAACADCRGRLDALRRELTALVPATPPEPPGYGRSVWKRVRGGRPRFALAAACVVAMLGAGLLLLDREPARAAPPAGLFQVILNVRDMERQVAFYRDVMRLELRLETPAFARFESGGMFLALHAGRESETRADEPRLSLRTDDVTRDRERLAALGVRVGAVRTPAPGLQVLDLRDPEGNVLHLEQRD